MKIGDSPDFFLISALTINKYFCISFIMLVVMRDYLSLINNQPTNYSPYQ
jgi:hypothetical protein